MLERSVLLKGSTQIERFGGSTMLYTLVTILLLVWLVGLLTHVGGSFIHTLLLIAGVLFVVEMISGRRTI